MLAQIEVEARRLVRFDLLPRARTHRDHRQPRRARQRLLRRGADDIELPLVHLEFARAQAAHRVDDHIGGVISDRARHGAEIDLHAGGCLVVRQQDAGDLLVAVGPQPRRQRFGVDSGAPRRLERLDGATPRLCDHGDPLAEDAGRARKQRVTRAEHVRHRRFEAARSRRPHQQHIACRRKDRLHTIRDTVQQAGILGAAMIDQRLRHRGQYGFGDDDRSRNEQQTLRHRLKTSSGRAACSGPYGSCKLCSYMYLPQYRPPSSCQALSYVAVEIDRDRVAAADQDADAFAGRWLVAA